MKEEEEDSPLPPLPLLPITSPATIRTCKTYQPTDDIFISSYPKSGTTWTQNIIFQLLAQDRLPLTHISDFMPFFEVDRTWQGSQVADVYREGHARLGRAVFNTHLRLDMMPEGGPHTRYIYLVRDAKDVCTSFYYHLSDQVVEDGGFDGSWDEFVKLWCEGGVAFGSWADHLVSWLGTTSTPHPAIRDPRVLVVHYEDLLADLKGQVERIVRHCDIAITPPALEVALSRMTFAYMKEHKHLYQPRSVRWKEGSSSNFIRKGVRGDYAALFEAQHHALVHGMLQTRFKGRVPPYIKDKVHDEA